VSADTLSNITSNHLAKMTYIGTYIIYENSKAWACPLAPNGNYGFDYKEYVVVELIIDSRGCNSLAVFFRDFQ